MSEKRTIGECQDIVEPLPPPDTGIEDWLVKQAADYTRCGLRYLLGFALDGVFWGELRSGGLHLSRDAEEKEAEARRKSGKEAGPIYSAELRDETLQEVRFFGEECELHIWRSNGAWKGRLIRPATDEETPTYVECLDEQQMLWGDRAQALGNSGFTLMSDGARGLRHAAPLTLTKQGYDVRPLRLGVRHYLAREDTARIVASRLFDLKEQ